MDSLVGQADPWKAEMFCGRKGCLPCQTRFTLAKEKEDRVVAMVSGEKVDKEPPKKTCSTLPGCTTEGILYTLDCQACRKEEVKRQYI